MIRITAYRSAKGSRQRLLAQGEYLGVGWSRANQTIGREGVEMFLLSFKDDKQGLVSVRMTRAEAMRLFDFVRKHEAEQAAIHYVSTGA